jgi:hypothetical protein
VHAGEVQVEKNQIVKLLVELTKALLARPDGIDPVPVLGENGEQEIPDVFLVLHDEHARGDFGFRIFFRHGFSVVGPVGPNAVF